MGLCPHPWRVAAHFRDAALRQEAPDLQVFPAMARPGLEPGTPRFSVVRVSLSNRAKTPANKRDARVLQRAGKNRKFRSVLGDSGDRWRPVARWCASAAGEPRAAPGRAPAVRSSRAPTASLALPRAHLENSGRAARALVHTGTRRPRPCLGGLDCCFHGRRSVVGAGRAAADAPSRRPKEYVSGHEATAPRAAPSTTRSTVQAGPLVRVDGA